MTRSDPLPSAPTLTRQFAAMGTTVTLSVWPRRGRRHQVQADLDRWEAWFHQAEAVLSRFRPDSELSRLNKASGRFHLVSPLLGQVLQAGLEAARLTGGLFDPAILPALEAAGYDRPFAQLKAQGVTGPALFTATPATRGAEQRPYPTLPTARHRPGDWQQVRLTPAAVAHRWLVDRPVGLRFDLGGVAKGWAADLVARRLSVYGVAAADVGGDIRVAQGDAGCLTPWPVEVADPLAPQAPLAELWLTDGAVATSDILGRRWRRSQGQGIGWQHHIIDPRSGEPAASELVAATVIAREAATAEALTKACLILGVASLPLLVAAGAEAILVRADGAVLATPALLDPRRVRWHRRPELLTSRHPANQVQQAPTCPGHPVKLASQPLGEGAPSC